MTKYEEIEENLRVLAREFPVGSEVTWGSKPFVGIVRSVKEHRSDICQMGGARLNEGAFYRPDHDTTYICVEHGGLCSGIYPKDITRVDDQPTVPEHDLEALEGENACLAVENEQLRARVAELESIVELEAKHEQLMVDDNGKFICEGDWVTYLTPSNKTVTGQLKRIQRTKFFATHHFIIVGSDKREDCNGAASEDGKSGWGVLPKNEHRIMRKD